MKKQVLFVILDQFADWEYSFLATALQGNIQGQGSTCEVKTIAVTKDPVTSIGGFRVLPDYSIDDYSGDYAALVLVGGNTWRSETAKKITPMLKQAYADKKVIGAICDATVFMGMNGLLNELKHTSNTLESLTLGAKENYTGQHNYVTEQAVRDQNVVTANGTGYLEFSREMLTALEAYPADLIESNYQFFKLGFIEFMKTLQA